MCRAVTVVLLVAPCLGLPPRVDGGSTGEEVWPNPDWPRATPAQMGMDSGKLEKARDYALTGGGSGFITRSGRLVFYWGDLKRRYDLKSTTKSIGVTALGLAVLDRKAKLQDRAEKHHPTFGTPPQENARTGSLEKITLLHLATHTAGFGKPGGYTALRFPPGTKWCYSDGGTNWLAECLTLIYGRDLKEVMFERVFSPLGIDGADLTWRRNAYRPKEIHGIPRREFGSGISANVDAMARIGYLYLRDGRWQDKRILPKEFVEMARRAFSGIVGLPVEKPDVYGKASNHYGLLWWNNGDGTLANVPRDAFWSWGLYESLIVIIPSLDIVAARAGASWKGGLSADYDRLRPFLEPLVESVLAGAAPRESVPRAQPRGRPSAGLPDPGPPLPYPPSPVVKRLTWAPADSIVRRARGSDNWPLTWADDDNLYGAYGDGWGFVPRVPSKLSLGIVKISGPATGFTGVNLRSPSIEQKGEGARGKKASGMLMVKGVLYMWVRNAGNAQLAWSMDHGKTWKWRPWKFATSFGCPTFLNFGRNYQQARDRFVYVYSPDQDSAYEPADCLVLARVPQDQITRRPAYEFFAGPDRQGRPRWSKTIKDRKAVFTFRGGCYRPSVSYCAPLRRYLLCQVIPKGDSPQRRGLGIYDAPEPWGPWCTAYFARAWDVDPGESASLPTKWMSPDGSTLYLVFSGEDALSVRRATLNAVLPERQDR